LQKIARVAKPNVEPTLQVGDEPGPSASLRPTGAWRYRNKVQIPFAQGPDGKLVGGFYAPGSHRVVPFEDCIVQPAVQVKIFHAVLEWFRTREVPAYDPKTGQGWARHLLIRTTSAGESLIAVISRDDYFPDAVHFSKFLQRDIPGVVSVFQNVNPKPGNVILGPQWRHLHGKRYLFETLSGLKFRLSPGSFFQVHHAMAEKLYQKVVDYLQPAAGDTVLELYAGVSAIAQILSKKVRYVWAVEENPAAVHAIESVKMNDIRNVRVLQGRCETVLTRGRFRKSLSDRLTAVVLDPPRAGCEQHVLRAVIRQAPQKIIYVSCDPATLARDAAYLSTGGYHLVQSIPVDLFPQTSHIESVSLFTKKPAPFPR
jgi:23S rRNA (uracil1939-C5)-methyltransferase